MLGNTHTLGDLQRRLAAMKARGMFGLNEQVANLSPAAQRLLHLIQLSMPAGREPPVLPPRPIFPEPPIPPLPIPPLPEPLPGEAGTQS